MDTARAGREAFWRVAIGKSFTEGRFGRSWSPMVEWVAARDLEDGARVQWDVVPQLQVTLSTQFESVKVMMPPVTVLPE